MPTPPTFVSGQPLTAAQMNTIGAHLVKVQTVGSGVSSVTVSGAFSADYDNYRVIYSGGVGSTGINLRLQLGSAAANYYGSIIYTTYSSATVTALVTNAGTSCQYVGGADTSFAHLSCDIFGPYLTKPTLVHCQYQDATAFGTSNYRLADTTSYTAFTITPNLGTLTGGTIRVYGYRNSLT